MAEPLYRSEHPRERRENIKSCYWGQVMGKLFKTSIFGGFRKKEVIEYLEKQTDDHRRELDLLNENVNRYQKDGANFQQELDERDAKIDGLQQELRALHEAAEEQRRQAEQAIQQAEASTAEAEKIAREYRDLKEYIADIELSAYKRAKEVQEEAARHAREVTKTIQTAGENMSPVAVEAREKVQLAEEAFGGFKERIASITNEIDELVKTIHDIEEKNLQSEKKMEPIPVEPPKNNPQGERLRSIQEILDRVKNIGEKM